MKPGSDRPADGGFCTTHWSLVMAAGRADSTRARDALGELFQAYWYPLYAFVRRLGHGAHDAEDLVQAFFERCLEKRFLEAADEGKGRFRSFLLIALKRFLANEWDKARARKRGGGAPVVSLDALTAEQRYALEPADTLTADRLFERRWALTVLNNVLSRLRDEHESAGRGRVFDGLKEALIPGTRETRYHDLAARLGMTEGAIKVAVHRLRRRYGELLEAEIAATVASPEEIAAERRHLLSVLSG